MTEKEIVEKTLRDRGAVNPDNTLNEVVFRKVVTEPWIYARVNAYGWHEKPINDAKIDAVKPADAPANETVKAEEKVSEIANMPASEEKLVTEPAPEVAPVAEKEVVTEPAPEVAPVEEAEEPIVTEVVEKEDAEIVPAVEEKPASKKKSKK